MAGIGQYLKDTRSELNHVAWPTRTQTIVFTILVAAISVGVAAYLGLFDFLFTTALTDVLGNSQNSAAQVQIASSSAAASTSTTGSSAAPSFTIQGASSTPTK